MVPMARLDAVPNHSDERDSETTSNRSRTDRSRPTNSSSSMQPPDVEIGIGAEKLKPLEAG